MVAAKPDCINQRFGFLTVVSKGEVVKASGKSRRLWNLLCECGTPVSLYRGDFDRLKGGQRSCGCMRHVGGLKPRNIAGQRFGELVAIELVPHIRQYNRPCWKLRCDCGGIAYMTLKRLNMGYRLNCGNRSKHLWGAWYPPTPNPYPVEASVIVTKYLHFAVARLHWQVVDQAVEDCRMDRLLRVAWIVVYRRSKGEEFSEQKERCYIAKSLRYARYTVDRMRRKGGLSYNRTNRLIGGVMTDLTSQNKAVDSQEQTQPKKILSKRVKFKRC